ncbi:MAG: hypothetical protein IJF73_01390 [Clostridia bacterium]|nr:hypothetical protein [Clostridia bacterium]
MELWQVLLKNATEEREGEGGVEIDTEKLFEKECYKVLERIRAILNNDSLTDSECFEKIESVVCLFEEIGSDGGSRHDFG